MLLETVIGLEIHAETKNKYKKYFVLVLQNLELGQMKIHVQYA